MLQKGLYLLYSSRCRSAAATASENTHDAASQALDDGPDAAGAPRQDGLTTVGYAVADAADDVAHRQASSSVAVLSQVQGDCSGCGLSQLCAGLLETAALEWRRGTESNNDHAAGNISIQIGPNSQTMCTAGPIAQHDPTQG